MTINGLDLDSLAPFSPAINVSCTLTAHNNAYLHRSYPPSTPFGMFGSNAHGLSALPVCPRELLAAGECSALIGIKPQHIFVEVTSFGGKGCHPVDTSWYKPAVAKESMLLRQLCLIWCSSVFPCGNQQTVEGSQPLPGCILWSRSCLEGICCLPGAERYEPNHAQPVSLTVCLQASLDHPLVYEILYQMSRRSFAACAC